MNEDLDKKIQAAIRQDASDDNAIPEPSGVVEEFFTTFRQRQRWLTAVIILANVGTLVGALWTGIKFYHAPDLMMALRWGGATLAFFFVFVVLKIWFWLEIHTNRVLREVKRVELMLVSHKRG